MSVYNGVFGGLKYNANYFGEVGENIVKLIEETWDFLPQISHENQKIYTNDFCEVISISFDKQNNCNGVFIGTNNQEVFDKILDTIDIGWSYISYEDEEE